MELASLALKIARSENLSALPNVVIAIIKKIQDQDAGVREIEGLIEQDPAIVAKILRAANSSYYGLREPVTSISTAINVLGTKTVQTMIISVAYQHALTSQSHAKEFDRQSFWLHSLAVGLIAKQIAVSKGRADANQCFMTGLLHDVGLLGLERHCPAQLDKILVVARASGVPLAECCRRALSFDWMDVGYVMATSWHFSEDMCNAIQHHRHPSSDKTNTDTTSIIGLADSVAHNAGFPNQTPTEKIPINEDAFIHLQLGQDALREIQERALEEVAATASAFGVGV